MNTATVVLKNLGIGYRAKHGSRMVASHIEASLLAGELTCLIGPNGVGKSTLLRTLSAFQPPMEGAVWMRGEEGLQPLTGYSPQQLAHLVGIVLTGRLEVERLKVEEVVGLGRQPYTGFWGTLSAADGKLVEQALREVGIAHLAGRNIGELSDGERQKVMIAKALAQECPVIILDEPTAFLDVTSRIETMSLLRDLAIKQNKTILLSTHDLDIAIQMADRLWLLSKEYGFASGAPEDLILNGTMTKFFSKDGIGFDSATGKFASELPQRSICVGGEPETVFWVGNALLRNGMRAVAYEENCTGIYCKSHDEIKLSISLEGGDFDTRNFNSVENLIHYIQRHPFSLN